MDKRDGLWIGAGLLAVIVCVTTPLLSNILMLLILGVIPGTDVTLPMWVAFIVYPLIGLTSLVWLAMHTFFIGEIRKPKPVRQVARTRKARNKKALSAKTTKRRSRAAV